MPQSLPSPSCWALGITHKPLACFFSSVSHVECSSLNQEALGWPGLGQSLSPVVGDVRAVCDFASGSGCPVLGLGEQYAGVGPFLFEAHCRCVDRCAWCSLGGLWTCTGSLPMQLGLREHRGVPLCTSASRTFVSEGVKGRGRDSPSLSFGSWAWTPGNSRCMPSPAVALHWGLGGSVLARAGMCWGMVL